MRLYSGMSPDFIRDSTHNRQFRYHPPPSEVNSWRNSLRAVSQVLDETGLHDHGIFLGASTAWSPAPAATAARRRTSRS